MLPISEKMLCIKVLYRSIQIPSYSIASSTVSQSYTLILLYTFLLYETEIKLTLFFSCLFVNFSQVHICRLIEGWVHVKEIGHKCQIKLVVALNDIIGFYKGTAFNFLGFLQHSFCSVMQI